MALTDLAIWAAIILAFFLTTTYLLKKIFKVQTFYVGSLIRTTKKLEWLEKFTFLGKWLDRFTELGLIFGFGILAADYMYGRGKPPLKRIIPSILTIIMLSVLYFGLEKLFGMENPFIKEFSFILMISFVLFGFAGFTVLSLLTYAIFIIASVSTGQKACPGVAPLIPGVEIPNSPVFIPWHAWISLLIILIIHEGMHGIIARREGFKIKSWGFLLLGLLPIGAFVEPDEEEMKKAEPKKSLRVFSGGPTANFLSIIPIIIILNLFFLLLIVPFFGNWAAEIQKNSVDYVYVTKVDQNINICGRIYESPAYGKLENGMIVKKINDKNVSKAAILSLEISANRKKPITLLLDKNGTDVNVTLTPTEFGSFGFQVTEKIKENENIPQEYKTFREIIGFVNGFTMWLIILSLLMAMANFIPIEPFDGGKIAKILLLPYFGFLNLSKEETEKWIGKILSWTIIILLALNALPLIL